MRECPVSAAPDKAPVDVPSEASLIARLYQAALEQPPWRGFLDDLRRTLDLHHCSISFFTGSGFDDRGTVTVTSGDHDLDYAELAEEYAQNFRKLDPLRYEDLAEGAVHVHSEADYLALGDDGAEFFRGYMAPHGFDHLAIVKPQTLGGSYGGLMVCVRSREAGAYDTQDMELLRALTPHLSRALQHFSRFKQLELERDLFESTIDNLGVGSLLIEQDGRVLRCNPRAERMLAEAEQLHITDGRLQLSDRTQSAEFRNLIEQLSAPGSANRIRAMRLSSRSGQALRVMLKPIQPAPVYYNTQPLQIMVYLQDTTSAQAAPAQLVAQLFGLTRTEATLAIWLARGHTLQQAAQTMGISEHTARNYSKRIFAKTGTSRQADLVRVMLQSVSLLTAG
ncbi:LuxR C-terminal-related transcriptional regulator [Hydrocarboniphaga effusa]|uniref:HTH luxR-type domain-containing protein n=1 Tax=Hydrocarboniphaga effusa AP103 TaxID=1172194 RepID=I8I3W3_9GAMM|nr:LuxR C-terminal-related transcriptional regulator [Hydrocarboniphaga effusa]EIT70811.1 hypothetical protein WQQ_09480 [Hydrocarboniphaga effusa AP103]